MHFRDRFQPRTHLEVVIYELGKAPHLLDLGSNVITTTGSANMSHCFVGDSVSTRAVSTMRFGSAGHNPTDPRLPLPVAPSDTDFFSPTIISKPIVYSFPNGDSSGLVRMEVEIGAGEGNGSGAQAYSEIGLFDAGDRMMTHKTFGLLSKSSVIGFLWRYSIQF